MDYSTLLANIARQVTLTEEETSLVTSLMRCKTLEAGEFLLREGEICRHQSFIFEGCLKSYHTDENGAEHILDFLIEEWWADDLYSFLTATPAKQNIRAIEDTELLQICQADLEQLYQRIPKIERFFRILFQNAYIAQNNHIKSLLSTTAEERYVQFCQAKPYAEKRFSQKDIASYLGVTPQFLSTLRKKLRS